MKGEAYWTEDGAFVLDGRRWVVDEKGLRVCLDPPGTPLFDPYGTQPVQKEGVSKMQLDEDVVGNYETALKRTRGRPKKDGEVSRTTLWRRRKI